MSASRWDATASAPTAPAPAESMVCAADDSTERMLQSASQRRMRATAESPWKSRTQT